MDASSPFSKFEKDLEREFNQSVDSLVSHGDQQRTVTFMEKVLYEGEPVSLDYLISSLPFLRGLGPKRNVRKYLRKLVNQHYNGDPAPLYFVHWQGGEAVSQFFIRLRDYGALSEDRKSTVAARCLAAMNDMTQAATERKRMKKEMVSSNCN